MFVEPSTPEESFYFRLAISLSLARLRVGSFCDSAQLLRSQQKPFKLSKYLDQSLIKTWEIFIVITCLVCAITGAERFYLGWWSFASMWCRYAKGVHCLHWVALLSRSRRVLVYKMLHEIQCMLLFFKFILFILSKYNLLDSPSIERAVVVIELHKSVFLTQRRCEVT